MANIKEYIDAIKNAVYGEQVRGSIINALNKINDDTNNTVKFSTTQELDDTQKSTARKNIGVDGGKWVLLRTYTTDGVNKAFGDGTTSNAGTTTTDGDGNALSLSAVSVVFKNTAAAAANSYAALFAYTASGENEYGGYSVSTNAVNTKENAQGVMTVFADRGYYRSLSIDGALKNSAYARENPSQAFVMTSDSVINQIKFVLGTIPPADDIIEIWGIKA